MESDSEEDDKDDRDHKEKFHYLKIAWAIGGAQCRNGCQDARKKNALKKKKKNDNL